MMMMRTQVVANGSGNLSSITGLNPTINGATGMRNGGNYSMTSNVNSNTSIADGPNKVGETKETGSTD